MCTERSLHIKSRIKSGYPDLREKVAETPDLPKWNGYANTMHDAKRPTACNCNVMYVT